MGQRNFTGVAFTKAGDKQQIVRGPGLMAATGCTAFGHQAVEHAAQCSNGQATFVELHKEDSPRLAADQRAQLFDGLNLDDVFGLEVDFLRLPVKEVDLPIIHVNRPTQLLMQLLHQLVHGVDLAQFVGYGVKCGVLAGCHVFLSP